MYTIKDIIELDPCEEYTREKLEELWKGKESLARREILELNIDIDDKNWVIPQLVSTDIVVKWAHLCAHEAEKHATTAYAAASAAEYATRSARYTRYAAEYTRSAAYWTAYYAADDTARSAANAGSAARSAANAADHAADAADHAADAAAWSAADTAAWYAADETRDKELYRLLTILCDMEEKCTL